MASLAFGILSFMCLPLLGGILAVALALVARSRKENVRGAGLATAGLSLGIVNLAVILVLASFVVPLSIHFLGKTRTVTRTVATQGTERAVVELRMRSGKATVEGGAESLFEGIFTYNVKDWEPRLNYAVRGGEGRLSAAQGGDRWAPASWFVRNDWLVRLSDEVPVDLSAELSSASAVFRLGSLSLRSLEVESGGGGIEVDLRGEMSDLGRVDLSQGSGELSLDLRGVYSNYVQMDVENASGRTEIDLRGRWEGGLGGYIKCGSGDVTLFLPEELGARVRVRQGSGRLRTEGMTLDSSDQDGKVYVNAAFRVSPVTLQVDLECHSGSVTLAVGE